MLKRIITEYVVDVASNIQSLFTENEVEKSLIDFSNTRHTF